ncbi:MAG: response regulator [Snowella sp.]|nr:response regulator [Snowella sp.]
MDDLILVVEDSDEDFEALRRVLRELAITCSLHRVCDGEDALGYLYQKNSFADAPRPSLILMDLNLPGTDGREVIQQIKQRDRLKAIPIVVLTTSANPKDIETCYFYGANSYLVKPMGIKKLKETIAIFYQYWFEVGILPSMEN